MRKYLSLTKVLLKCSMGAISDGKAKKRTTYLLYGFLLLCMIPIPVGLYVMLSSLLEAYAGIDQIGSAMGSVFFLAAILIFLFSLLLIPSIFYFSKDNAILLGLPLKPEQILASKFSTCVIYEYVFCIFLLLPAFAAYAQFMHPGPLFYLVAVLIFFLLPIYPLVLSTILTILVMRFVPFFKNRDSFNMVAGILTVALALGFSFASQSFVNTDANALLAMVLEGNNSMLSLFSSFFPAIPAFARALCEGDIVQLLLAIGIQILALLILMTLGKFLYFKGAIGFGETSSSHKKIEADDMKKAAHTKHKWLAYTVKEMKSLVRTPVYFLNCVSICLIMPVLLCFMPMMSGQGSSMDLTQLLSLFSSDTIPYSYVIFIGIGAGFFLGTLNSVSATAISREGSQMMVMKYLPMAYKDQIHAKSLCGILLGILTLAFTMLPLVLMLPLSIEYYGIIFLCGCITTVLGNELGIIFDVLHPKLVWEQEAAAVKQNMGAMLVMFSGMALCFLCIAICFVVPDHYLTLASLASLVVVSIGAIVSWIAAGNIAESGMRKL